MGIFRNHLQRPSRDEEDRLMASHFKKIISETERGNPVRANSLDRLFQSIKQDPYFLVSVAENKPYLIVELMNEAFICFERSTLGATSIITSMRRKVDHEIFDYFKSKREHILAKIFSNHPRFVNNFKRRNQEWTKDVAYLIENTDYSEFDKKIRRLRWVDSRILKRLEKNNEKKSDWSAITEEQRERINKFKDKVSEVDDISAEDFEKILLKFPSPSTTELVAWEAIANTYQDVVENQFTVRRDRGLNQNEKKEIYKIIIKTSQFRLTKQDYDDLKFLNDSEAEEIERLYSRKYCDLAFNKF